MFRIVGAEPTLHKHCIDFIKIVLDEGHMCLLITNGLRLSSPSFVKKLQATGLKQIYMSMNGVDRDDWYEEIDDLACAEKKLKAFKNIANKFNADHHVISIENFLEDLPKAISIIKMPFWDTHWFHMVKTATKFSTTLVSGDGGDELFGGYTFRYKKFLGLTISPMIQINKYRTYFGIGIGQMIGLVR